MIDVEVKVPATVANIGPGFDCLGAALGLYLEIRITKSSEPAITGKGRIRDVASNLTHRAFVSAFAAVEKEAPAVSIEMLEIYPSARGLGASASAIVAGLAGARAFGDLDIPDAELARLAVRMEGHGDNVLPAFFGGLVLNSHEGWMHFEPTRNISPMILVAAQKFKTSSARAVLPAEVPREDAVANSSATAGLVAVLTGTGPVESLMICTEDRLHEPYRLPLMPETFDLRENLREKGIPTAMAGAGPSLISLVESSELPDAREVAGALLPEGWRIITPGWDMTGAEIR